MDIDLRTTIIDGGYAYDKEDYEKVKKAWQEKTQMPKLDELEQIQKDY